MNRALQKLVCEVERASRSPMRSGVPEWALHLVGRGNGKPLASDALVIRTFDDLFAAVQAQIARKGESSSPSLGTSPTAERVLQHIPIGAILVDSRGTVRHANKKCCNELGLSQERIQGMAFEKLPIRFVDETGQEFVDQPKVFAALLARRRAVENLLVAVGPRDPDKRYFALSAQPHEMIKGEVDLLVSLTDVTRQVLVERALRSVNERMRALLEAIPHGVVELDRCGRCTLASQTFAEKVGKTPDEMRGEEIFRFFAIGCREKVKADLEKWLGRGTGTLLAWGTVESTPEQHFQLDGRVKRNGGANDTGFVVVFTDVTDRRRLERHLLIKAADMFELSSWVERARLDSPVIREAREEFQDSGRHPGGPR